MGQIRAFDAGALSPTCPDQTAVNPNFNCCGDVEAGAAAVTADLLDANGHPIANQHYVTQDIGTGIYRISVTNAPTTATHLLVCSWQTAPPPLGTKLHEVNTAISVQSGHGDDCSCPPGSFLGNLCRRLRRRWRGLLLRLGWYRSKQPVPVPPPPA